MSTLDEEPEAGNRARSGVSIHRSAPDRVVFTEEGNSDGWIATDHTVELVE